MKICFHISFFYCLFHFIIKKEEGKGMNISKFYRQSSCPKMAQLDGMIKSPLNRNYILSKQIRTVCYMLCAKESRERILNRVSAELKEAYKELPKSFAWQEKEWLNADLGKIERFMDFLTADKLIPVACDKLVEQRLDVIMPDGSMNLTCLVPLIVQKADVPSHVRALFIHPGKTNRSMGGKSHSTKAESDLNAIVAKLVLEEEYPNIEIDVVYLTNDGDRDSGITSFVKNGTKKSNLHQITYSTFYSKEGVFDRNRMLSLACEVVESQVAQECDGCRKQYLCQTPLFPSKTSSSMSLDEKLAEVEKKKELARYHLPNYTDEQFEVVNFGSGAMVVCAGPGSGKTATLAGRIYHLVKEEQIPPELILVVTFTKKAVGELKERCLGFLEEKQVPTICTFHSFCYKVLRDNKHLLQNGTVVALTDMAKIDIIKNLVSVLPKMKGFNYDCTDGEYGLYRTISKRITEYESWGVEEFLRKYDCDESFFNFYDQFKLAVEDGGYITFDQMVTLCNELLEHHPELLGVYQDVYRYVMVDEYQDVNEEQVQLLYSLVKKHKNIVVVGDDDQTIYSFRGSDAKFMINFDKDFPGAKKVVFTKNFRSSKAIVEAAKMLIANNKKRIAKDIESQKGDFGKKELPPVIIPSMDPLVIDGLIDSLIEEGYTYGDIGLLSSQNKYLNSLHRELKAPTVLSKSYLGEDAFFILFYSVARLYLDRKDDTAAYQYFRLFNADFSVVKDEDSLLSTVLKQCGIQAVEDVQSMAMDCSCGYENAVNDLFNYFCVLEQQQENLLGALDTLLLLTGWTSSNVGDELKDIIDNNKFETLADMVAYLNDLMAYEPESVRVEFEKEDKITLITSHESKGKEYKVVIFRNDILKKEDMEDVRRVTYVTVTRPMERVYILQGEDTKFDVSEEIDHIVLEV